MDIKKIILEGNISSGKTSLINFLKENIEDVNIDIYDSGFSLFHPNPKYNLLQYNNKNPKEWCFTTQLVFMKLMNEIQNQNMNKKINIFNRSIYSVQHVFNNVYKDESLISEDEYSYLLKTYENLLKKQTVPIDLLIFFKSDSEILESRKTTNPFKSYISKFQNYYSDLLKILKEQRNIKSVYIIDSNKNLEELKEDYSKILNYCF